MSTDERTKESLEKFYFQKPVAEDCNASGERRAEGWRRCVEGSSGNDRQESRFYLGSHGLVQLPTCKFFNQV